MKQQIEAGSKAWPAPLPKKAATFLFWFRLLSFAGIVQALIQLLGLMSGIVLFRHLSTQEYAFYTLANTMLGTMTVLADGGIATGVLSQGGKVWQDREALGKVVRTGLHLRRRFGIFGLVVTLPVLYLLLIHHGASHLLAFCIGLAMIPSFYSTLSDTLLEVPAKLNQDWKALQKNQAEVSVLRTVGILLGCLFFPFAPVIILINGVPRIWGNTKLRKMVLPYANWKAPVDANIKQQIVKIVKHTLPSAIYFCLSSQITVWMVSILGSTESVAGLGALGRLATILTVVSAVFNIILIPRFSRMANDPAKILQVYLKALLAIVFFCMVLFLAVYFMPELFLSILGPGYANLNKELVLTFTSAFINLAVGASISLNSARGWILHPAINIGVGMVGTLLGIIWFDFSTMLGAVQYNVFCSVIGLVVHPSLGIYHIYKARHKPLVLP